MRASEFSSSAAVDVLECSTAYARRRPEGDTAEIEGIAVRPHSTLFPSSNLGNVMSSMGRCTMIVAIPLQYLNFCEECDFSGWVSTKTCLRLRAEKRGLWARRGEVGSGCEVKGEWSRANLVATCWPCKVALAVPRGFISCAAVHAAVVALAEVLQVGEPSLLFLYLTLCAARKGGRTA